MRKIDKILKAQSSIDGAGVKLQRVFGYDERKTFDPFLLLDHFGSDNPADYIAGFPWHPHRGIETVTYLIEGKVAHGDSMGNKGTISPGDAQWMTAGSGIIHQEMPEPGPDGKRMEGFQLWVNLPSNLKMTTPRYRAVEAAEIPRIMKEGCEIAVIAGEYDGVAGATPNLFVPVLYLIVTMNAGAGLRLRVQESHNAALYLFRGKASIAGKQLGAGELAHLPGADAHSVAEEGSDDVEIQADPEVGAAFLFIAGERLNQTIAWGGPIVMNTRQELELAFEEFNKGTFIKTQAAGI
jgi:quercetin 2,3-dioxygenase